MHLFSVRPELLMTDRRATEPLGSAGSSRPSVALVSPPWHLANRPSLPLSVLSGYLRAHGHPVDAVHLHLRVAARFGFERYLAISQEWKTGEALFSALLAPNERERLLAESRTGDGHLEPDAGWLQDLSASYDDAIAAFRLDDYVLVGVSVCHLQLAASLVLLERLKRLAPGILVIFGGRSVSGEAGAELLRRHPSLDAVVDGEGEEALLDLATLPPPWSPADLRRVPNLWFRPGGEKVEHTRARVMASLNGVAPPDHSDFFDLAAREGLALAESTLPIEASRGCPWEYRTHERPTGCAFCGLNVWPSHREKALSNMLDEIDALIARHRVLDLSFADSTMPSYGKELLRRLAVRGRDLTIFFELRADFDEETATLLAAAGARRLQIGIESLSTTLLARLGKGVRAIQNVNALKLCEERGIPYQYNLLMNVPGANQREIDESLAWMQLLHGFAPPHLVPFYLARGSRMHRHPEAFGIDPASLDGVPCTYLPARLAFSRLTAEVPFSCSESSLPNDAWAPLAEGVARWQELRRAGRGRLTMRNGGSFLSIEDDRQGLGRMYILEGLAREIVMAAGTLTSMRTLLRATHLPDMTVLEGGVNELARLGLVLRENDEVLALPVRARHASGDEN
jgi:ribosomal peptide maturation radical SAM protein 1